MNKDIYKNNWTKQEYEDYLIECLSKCIIKHNKKEDVLKLFSSLNLQKENNNIYNQNNLTNKKDLFEIRQNENGDDVFFVNNVIVDQESFLQKLAKQTAK